MGWNFSRGVNAYESADYFDVFRRGREMVVPFARLALATGFAAGLRAGFAPAGSPVAAFATSPPPSSAICASSRLLTIDRGFSAVMSAVDTY
jgi:hypothetical protein